MTRRATAVLLAALAVGGCLQSLNDSPERLAERAQAAFTRRPAGESDEDG